METIIQNSVPQGTPNELVLSLAIIVIGAVIRYFERRALRRERKDSKQK